MLNQRRTRLPGWMIIFAGLAVLLLPNPAPATAPPSHTAVIVVRGFDSEGASRTGPFGTDLPDSSIAALAATLGLPTGDVAPTAPNQVAYCDYYGTSTPSYYTAQDIADLNAVTTLYGGGVPRYAMIVAKFAKEVMRRSGAQQVTIFGVSFGGLVSRWMMEKDVEALVSGGKVARWIGVEGVIAGNWIASEGGQTLIDFVDNNFDLASIDLVHMQYAWVQANLHNPNTAADNALLGAIPIHFWISSDDSYNSQALSVASQKPNDGVVLLRDAFLQSMTPQSCYLGLRPTLGLVHATHQSSKDNLGLRAGIAAELLGRRRVTATLTQVRVTNDQEVTGLEPAEVVFGARVYSPRAQTLYGITDPIRELRHDDNNLNYASVPEDTTTTVNQAWFDGMVLPGETQLNIQTNVDEIDFDPLFGINENLLQPNDSLSDTALTISTMMPGTYFISTSDWTGELVVTIMDYPPFDPPPTTVGDWAIYM